MKNLQLINTEITQLTAEIETSYPELYQFLMEQPITLPTEKHPHMDAKVMSSYLEELQQMLRRHIETRKNINKAQ